jgi:hypothetical protein
MLPAPLFDSIDPHMKVIFSSRKYLCLAFVAAAISFSTPKLAAASDESTTETNYDFGAVKQGERVLHSFYIKNTLAIPLQIERIDLSAPGMTTRVQPVIDAGAKGEIEIAWNTSKVARDVTARATVHFVGDQLPDLTLVLSGKVTPEIEAVPLAGFYISLFKDEAAENSITLINHRDHQLVVTKIDAQSSYFAAALDTAAPGRVYKLIVKVPAGIQPGRYADTINLKTDDATNPVIRIPVNILVKDVIYASQSVVDVGDIDRSKLKVASNLFAHIVTVRKRAGEFAIKSITSDVPGLHASHTPETASQSFDLQIELNPDTIKPGPLTGTIRILTNDSAVPELTVTVQGNVK